MTQRKDVFDERMLRLDCLKIAANLVCQLADPKISALDLARQYFAFVIEDDGKEDSRF